MGYVFRRPFDYSAIHILSVVFREAPEEAGNITTLKTLDTALFAKIKTINTTVIANVKTANTVP